MIKGGMKMTKDALPQVMESIKSLTRKDVLVGIPAEHAHRDPEENEAPLTNAEIGYIHEFGAPEANIPARPHMIPGIKSKSKEIVQVLKKGASQVLDGHNEAAAQSLMAAGFLGSSAVKKKITDGPFAPLAPATIANRKARGKTSSKPLIDTGQYRNAITFVIRDKTRGRTSANLPISVKEKIEVTWRRTPEG